MNQLISDLPGGTEARASMAVEKLSPAMESPCWDVHRIEALLDLPFNDLIHRAQSVHRQYHDPNGVQLSTLISVKTGGCSEDCGYCPQAARYHTGVENQEMLTLDEVLAAAAEAKARGASRFCMGAAWRGPKQRDIEKIKIGRAHV